MRPTIKRMERRLTRRGVGAAPVTTIDLGTQIESLFDIVWRCERVWDLEDRIEQNIRWDQFRTRSTAGSTDSRD